MQIVELCTENGVLRYYMYSRARSDCIIQRQRWVPQDGVITQFWGQMRNPLSHKLFAWDAKVVTKVPLIS